MHDLVIDTVIKATALVGCAAVLALGMRRAAAARRHLLWTLTLGALLVLPAAETAIPAWRVLPVARVPAGAGIAVLARPVAVTTAPLPTAQPGAPTAATRAWLPGAATSQAVGRSLDRGRPPRTSPSNAVTTHTAPSPRTGPRG